MLVNRNIADAVNLYLKALRRIGCEKTSIANIARALIITESLVEAAFQQFKMVGASIEVNRQVTNIKTITEFSKVVTLK